MLQFFDPFKKELSRSWSLHLTNLHLRLIEVTGKKDRWKITRVGKTELSPGTVENGVVKSKEEFFRKLEKLKLETFPGAPKNNQIITNINEEYAFFRTVQMPKMNEKEIEEAIRWEAESNIPLPIDKVHLAWEVIKDLGNGKISVLLAATPQNIIEEKIATFKESGLTCLVVEPESVALCRALAFKDRGLFTTEPIIILNLKEHYTHIIVFDSEIIHLSTISDVSSEDFDASIGRAFNIKINEAEKFRQKIGWQPEAELGQKLIETTGLIFSSLRREIGSAVSFYKDKTGKDIKKILLTAEKPSKWNAFDRFLAKEVGLEVCWQTPWKKEIWPSQYPLSEQDNEEFNIAIGLSLRKFEDIF